MTKLHTLSSIGNNFEAKLDSKRSAHIDNDDSFIRPFIKKEEKSNIKDEYLVLWYEKLALEEYVDRLMRENMKKDETIMRLRHDLQQVRGSRRL
jgi:hypothetical protein